MVMDIFDSLRSYFSWKIIYKAFYNRVVSQLQEKVGCIVVLSEEHTAHVVVAGLDKATISMYCYLAMSRSPDIPQRRQR